MKILIPFFLFAAVVVAAGRWSGASVDAAGLASAFLAAGLLAWPLTERPPAPRPAAARAVRCAASPSGLPCVPCGAR